MEALLRDLHAQARYSADKGHAEAQRAAVARELQQLRAWQRHEAVQPLGPTRPSSTSEARHAALTFVGVFPGVMPTELPRRTFPKWVLPALTAAMLPVAASEAEVGLALAAILASPNAARRRVSYFNAVTLEGLSLIHI